MTEGGSLTICSSWQLCQAAIPACWMPIATSTWVQTKDVPSLFYLPSDCEELSHLGVLGALKLTDQLLKSHRNWKCYSSVAIVANTLRDLEQSVFNVWRALFGDANALSKVKSLIPHCVAGRWRPYQKPSVAC